MLQEALSGYDMVDAICFPVVTRHVHAKDTRWRSLTLAVDALPGFVKYDLS